MTLTVTDDDGATASINHDLTINPSQPPVTDTTPPIIQNVVITPNPVAVNSQPVLKATIDDSTTGNSKIVTVQYSTDGNNWVTISIPGGTPTVQAQATLPGYTTADIISIYVRATDSAGNTATSEPVLLAVYDPNGAFLTAGGWFTSPAGAYKANPASTGKVNLGLNSKYKSGSQAPTGETEVKFKEAGMNFKATAYDWMVISGAKATYQGSGTINGAGSYGFLVSALSGDVSKGGDKVRVKIWEKGTSRIIYDNGMGADTADPTTSLGGGSIKLHK